MTKTTTTLRNFADLGKVISVVSETQVIPKTPQEAKALAEKVFGPPATEKAATENVETVEDGVFITQMNNAVGAGNFKVAFALGAKHGASRKARAAFRFKATLPALMTALQPVRALTKLPELGSESYAFVAAHLTAIDERLSALNQQAMKRNTITRLENFGELAAKSTVVWPDAVPKPVLVSDSVPMVVSVQPGFEFPKEISVQPVAGRVFIVPMTVIAVPDRGENRDSLAISAASRFAEARGLAAVPLPLRRTESDGVLFAAIAVPLAAEEINFLDRVKPSEHSKYDAAMRALAIRKQRDRRLAFEALHADLYDMARGNRITLADLEDQREELREKFVGFTGGLSPATGERLLTKKTRQLLDEDLAGERSAAERVRIRLMWQKAMVEAMALREQYRQISAQIKTTKANLVRCEERINTLKLEALRGISSTVIPVTGSVH